MCRVCATSFWSWASGVPEASNASTASLVLWASISASKRTAGWAALITGAAIQPRTPPRQSASGTAAISRESRRTPRACASDVGALSGGRMAPFGHPCSHSRQVMQVWTVTEGVFHETKEKSRSKTPYGQTYRQNGRETNSPSTRKATVGMEQLHRKSGR